MTNKQKIICHCKRAVRVLGIALLYLFFVYWTSQAFLKYFDEPTSTSITYTMGDPGQYIHPLCFLKKGAL